MAKPLHRVPLSTIKLDRWLYRCMSVVAALSYINDLLTNGWFRSLASGMLLIVLLSYWHEKQASSPGWRTARILASIIFIALALYSMWRGYNDGAVGAPRSVDYL